MRIRSIKGKITTIFSIAFLIMLVLLVAINNYYMDDFYIASNRTKMQEVAAEFEELVSKIGPKKAIDEISDESGSLLYIYDQQYRLLPGADTDKPWKNFSALDVERFKNATNNKIGGTYFEVIDNEEADDSLLVFVRILRSGDLLLQTKKMGLAKEVTLLNFRFMMMTSVFIYLIALMVIYIISSRLSKPVEDIMNKTEKMSQLDFSERIDIWPIEELGRLSISINRLSDKLSSTINQLNDANRNLNIELQNEKKLEKMRRKFVSDVSHELKNPISMILGFADGLKHNIVKTEEDKAYYYHVITEECLKINRLINDLLDLSSYESGSFTLSKETVDLTQIVNNNIEKFSHQIKDRNLRIVFDSPAEALLFADGLRLEQVVTNLISNALKYVDEEGVINIRLKKIEDKVSLIIANTGPLIPHNELENIWNSFYQIDNSKRGSGLGLAIVKSIVLLHGGTCRAFIDGEYNCFEIVI